MDYKFLHRVINQIVSETEIDYVKKRMYFPFSTSHSLLSTSLPTLMFLHLSSTNYNIRSLPPFPFSKHCKDIYGLNEQEIEYVWRVYSDDIRYKIKEEKYT